MPLPESKARRLVPVLALAVAVLLCVTTACGKKGPPRPMALSAPPAPTQVAAGYRDGVITLTWNPPPGDGTIRGFEVSVASRSLTDPCTGCPLVFQPAGTTEAGTTVFLFSPARGNRYYLRVGTVGLDGGIGDPSASVQVEVP
jgi:predicted small lipoprotein YifL